MLDTPRTTLVAAIVQGNAAYLGALRRFAPVPRARRQAAHAHPRPLLPGAADGRRGPHGPDQPQRPVHLPGLADQAGVRRHRPGPACSRATRSCCAPTACGAAWSDDDIVRELSSQAGLRGRARAGRAGAAQRRRERQRHRDRRRVGNAGHLRRPAAISTDSICDGVFASTIQAGVLDTLVDDLDEAAIERSIPEINEAIRRSAARRSPERFAPAGSPRAPAQSCGLRPTRVPSP